MNIKLKALLLTGGFFASCVLFAVGLQWFLSSFDAAQITFVAQCLAVLLLGYGVYGLILTKLEMEKSLDKLKKL
jgi:hypothetical protein